MCRAVRVYLRIPPAGRPPRFTEDAVRLNLVRTSVPLSTLIIDHAEAPAEH